MTSHRANPVGLAAPFGPLALLRAIVSIGPAWLTLLATAILCALSVYAVDLATTLTHAPGETLSPYASKQLVFATVGCGLSLVVMLVPPRWLGFASIPLAIFTIFLLVFLLIPAVPTSIVKPRHGARSWIDIGPLQLQPSEFAKITYVVALAWFLRRHKGRKTLKGLAMPFAITLIPIGLINLQPDLGTASLFVPALFAMLIAAGSRLRHLTLIVVAALAIAPAAYPLLRPHQKARIVGLMQQFKGDTSADQDINMQSSTAKRLLAAGGITGNTEARSRVYIRYSGLPERHNDMIPAVIANRFGLVGVLTMLGLFGVWIAGALLVGATAHDTYGRLVCVGCAAFVGGQVFVNLGMNLGLLPIIGITLPFVSYGGSSMLASWMMSGLVASVALRRGVAPRRAFNAAQNEDE